MNNCEVGEEDASPSHISDYLSLSSFFVTIIYDEEFSFSLYGTQVLGFVEN